ncbi:hypothetical protein TDB9533_04190 [Thalassocella blandensis]|nr:hypothetical protein TDB9533_04190 [Thalassocella blandensis]
MTGTYKHLFSSKKIVFKFCAALDTFNLLYFFNDVSTDIRATHAIPAVEYLNRSKATYLKCFGTTNNYLFLPHLYSHTLNNHRPIYIRNNCALLVLALKTRFPAVYTLKNSLLFIDIQFAHPPNKKKPDQKIGPSLCHYWLIGNRRALALLSLYTLQIDIGLEHEIRLVGMTLCEE